MPSKMKSLKRLEFHWLQFRGVLKQHVTGRYILRVLTVLGLIVVGLCIRRYLNKPVFFTSAISCKSKIAQIVLPNEQKMRDYLKSMGNNFYDLENDFFYFVSTMTVNCQDQVHLGPPEEGGWDVCLDPRFNIRQPCLVYSFGINNDFRFEKGIEELLTCEVHSFDPRLHRRRRSLFQNAESIMAKLPCRIAKVRKWETTSMRVESHQYSAFGYFHNYGIDSIETTVTRGNWRLRRLENIMKELGHEGRTIDYLKMDIEFSEWPVLYDLISTRLISQVRQLALEVHTPEVDIHDYPDNVCTWSNVETMAFMMKTLIGLRNSGFSLFYNRPNYRTKFTSPITGQERYCCHNLHFVNLKHPGNRY